MDKKYLFITGASGDIGKSIAGIFEKNGYSVIAPGSKEMDCSSEASIDAFFNSFSIERIDTFVHCAGWNKPQSFDAVTTDIISRSAMINSFSMLKIIQKLDQYMVDHVSRVVAISSLYGVFTRRGRLAYTSSKHSLNGMIKELGIELGTRGILCNTVSPGFIETKMTYQNNSQETINDFISRIPVGRLGSTDDIAGITYFLGSASNSYINGQNIIIDGGYSIGGFQNT